MKTTQAFVMILIVSAISFTRCEYQPHGGYMADVSLPDSTHLQIDLNPDDSIIYVFEPAYLNYHIQLGEKRLLLAELYIDDELYFSQKANPGSFGIDPYKFEAGIYKLDLILYTSSGSGSLADTLGAEGFIFEYSWKAVMETAEPLPSQITDISVVDGRLKISWEKNEQLNFKHYRLWRSWHPNPYQQADGQLLIHDQDQNWYIDSTYLGNWAHYSIAVSCHGHDHGANSETSMIEYPTPQLKMEVDEDFNITFSWNACSMYANLSQYELQITSFSPDSIIHQTSDPSDTSISIVGGLFPEYNYRLYWYGDSSKLLPSGYMVCNAEFLPGKYLGIPAEQFAFTISYPQKLYAVSYDEIYQYDALSVSLQQETQGNERPHDICASPNNDYLIQSTVFDNIIKIFNPNELNDFQNIEISNLIGYYAKLYQVDVANNGLLVGILSDGNILGYDIESGDTLFIVSASLSPDVSRIYISPSGSYFLTWEHPEYETYLYQIQNSEIDRVIYLGNEFRNVYFIPDKSLDQYYCLTTGQEIRIYKCADQSLISSFPSSSERISNIDPISGYLVGSNHTTDTYQFYDPGNGGLIKELKAGNPAYYPFLLDSKLFTGAYYYPLNF
ncbi:MAG: WD40 repeat domain-containing protein [Bacteroidota bacterium]|nr:WD40 repeat domain-containing protein [Bacteroidota bacterium]